MRFSDFKRKAEEQFGRGNIIFTDPKSWELIEKYIPEECWDYFLELDGAYKLADKLPEIFRLGELIDEPEKVTCWTRSGNFFKNTERFFDAIAIYRSLYYRFLDDQVKSGQRKDKTEILIWLSECYFFLNCFVMAKRYLMLALCEKALTTSGRIDPNKTGIYFRLVWRMGLSDAEFKRYSEEIVSTELINPKYSIFPELILLNLDNQWMSESPSSREMKLYDINIILVEKMINDLGDKTGNELEILAEYILSCVPGFRVKRRQRSMSTEYDLVCSVEGLEVDFRSEIGRYFVCECKDWKKPANFDVIAKFGRILTSTKLKFGILFSLNGITGEKKTTDAERERIKLFQDSDIVIIVVNKKDLDEIANGRNFITILRNKYESTRMDLIRL